jgi:hypothetical protein
MQADGIGRIGLRKLLAGDVADAASVDVNYIRRSDAEIFSAPKGEMQAAKGRGRRADPSRD